ncbi:MAG: hypothetical protein E7E25_06040 [Fusobacterium periodonticum]|mgnify:FL=1|jgi:hypothetical protein|nr:hypothetical protein [Fusobacterium pseudoperiodonticum]MDU2235659.1 hypothetical protein [Fusobacterium periodonticum]
MEIEIKEKIDSLEITKNCKQELRKITCIIIFLILLIYFLYIYYNPSMFLLFPIYEAPFAYIIFTIICQRYKYEVIYINSDKIKFSSSYTEKNSKTSMTSFFKIKNLKEIY